MKCSKCGKDVDFDYSVAHVKKDYILCRECTDKWKAYFDKHVLPYEKMLENGKIHSFEYVKIWDKYFLRFLRSIEMVLT